MGMPVGMPEVKGIPAAVDLAKNPLAETHEFRQACLICYVKTGEETALMTTCHLLSDSVNKGSEVAFNCSPFTSAGPGVLDYTLHTEDHKCKKDVLLGRLKHSLDKTWKQIRPRPTKTQYVGPYYICKGTFFYHSTYFVICCCNVAISVYVISASNISVSELEPVFQMSSLLFQRWLLDRTACTQATAHLHTVRKKLMFGLWSEKGSSPESCSLILSGPTPMLG